MGFLDFMKGRPKAPEPATKPAAPKPIEQTLSPDALAQARAAAQRIERATVHVRTPAPESAAGGGSNEALRQKQNNQQKTQAALSPTDRFKGVAPSQRRGMSRGR